MLFILYTNKIQVLIYVSISNYRKHVKFPVDTGLPSFWQCTNFRELLMRYKVR